jgi:hypothetical protein
MLMIAKLSLTRSFSVKDGQRSVFRPGGLFVKWMDRAGGEVSGELSKFLTACVQVEAVERVKLSLWATCALLRGCKTEGSLETRARAFLDTNHEKVGGVRV